MLLRISNCWIGSRPDWNGKFVSREVRSARERSVPAEPSLRRFLGLCRTPELISQMSVASIFAHPALYEPFGLSVLEAARAGCCLILSDIPSLRELWDGAAIFVDPRQPEAWVRELNRLTNNPQRVRKLWVRSLIHTQCNTGQARR